MFIGHFALGLAGKAVAPKTSLGTLLLSVGFVDVLWPFFLFFGLEHVRIQPGNTAFTPFDFYDYPLSHSLVANIFWGLAFAGVYYAFTRYQRGAIIVGLGVLSHWLLDFLSHGPDMPIFLSGGPKYGLGLWNSIAATLIIESLMFAAGIYIYLKTTVAENKKGSIGFYAFIALMFVSYLLNAFGPPPPNVEAIAALGPSSLLLFAIPYWIDRHRKVVKTRD